MEQYWFNYDGDNWLPEFDHKSVGQVYGSAYNFGTFFSGDPVNIYGIHWLPTGEYLTSYGFDPQKAADLYDGHGRGQRRSGERVVAYRLADRIA